MWEQAEAAAWGWQSAAARRAPAPGAAWQLVPRGHGIQVAGTRSPPPPRGACAAAAPAGVARQAVVAALVERRRPERSERRVPRASHAGAQLGLLEDRLRLRRVAAAGLPAPLVAGWARRLGGEGGPQQLRRLCRRAPSRGGGRLRHRRRGGAGRSGRRGGRRAPGRGLLALLLPRRRVASPRAAPAPASPWPLRAPHAPGATAAARRNVPGCTPAPAGRARTAAPPRSTAMLGLSAACMPLHSMKGRSHCVSCSSRATVTILPTICGGAGAGQGQGVGGVWAGRSGRRVDTCGQRPPRVRLHEPCRARAAAAAQLLAPPPPCRPPWRSGHLVGEGGGAQKAAARGPRVQHHHQIQGLHARQPDLRHGG